jgi:hypothetical protein
VIVAAFNLFMNVASGAMRLPLLPAATILIGAGAWSPWYIGASLGLLVWTAIEALGELPIIRRAIGWRT